MHRPLIALCLLSLAGCERAMQDMYEQPRYRGMEPDPFFADGLSARLPEPGTVIAKAGPFADSSGGRVAEIPEPDVAPPVRPIFAVPTEEREIPTDLPVRVDAALLARGRERFEIFCAPCHGLTGEGDGMIVRRGFPAPPSYHTPRLRQAPSSHYYQVITHGYGAMYSYAARVAPKDRWAIIAYVRALQLSQHTPLADLTPRERARLEERWP